MKQRKAVGISAPDVVESLSLGTDSLTPINTAEQSVKNIDELEALPSIGLGDTGEGVMPVEGVSGDGESSVGGVVDSPVTKDPSQRLTRRSTLLSHDDPLFVEQMLEQNKEREGPYIYVIIQFVGCKHSPITNMIFWSNVSPISSTWRAC